MLPFVPVVEQRRLEKKKAKESRAGNMFKPFPEPKGSGSKWKFDELWELFSYKNEAIAFSIKLLLFLTFIKLWLTFKITFYYYISLCHGICWRRLRLRPLYYLLLTLLKKSVLNSSSGHYRGKYFSAMTRWKKKRCLIAFWDLTI